LGDWPLHLLLPLCASLLFTFGALFVKRATSDGVSVWTINYFANLVAAVAFSFFWSTEGEIPWSLIWQPMVIALLYLGGQTAILSAVNYGDVSVAMPIAGSKVILVAGLLAALAIVPPSLTTWIAVILATAGVLLINYMAPKSDRKKVLLTALLAMTAVSTFAVFDVCLQFWSPNWGAGRILAMSFWFVAVYAQLLLPLIDRPLLKFDLAWVKSKPWKSWLLGSFFIGVQAIFICFALSKFGDAARVNVVYSIRGFWGVAFAWGLARWFHGAEENLPRNIMLARLSGAALLIVAVIVVILSSESA